MALFKIVNQFIYGPGSPQPDTVMEVKASNYINYETYEREDGLFIYGISETDQSSAASTSALMKVATDEPNFKFEVVFVKDTSPRAQTAYSLFRARNLEEAKEIFNLLSNKIPLLNLLCPNLITEKNLQDILNYSRNFPQQTLAHVCAHFGHTAYFKTDKTLNFIDKDKLVCPLTSHTPIHLAVLSKNLEIVNILMDLDFLAELIFVVEDNDGNNIFHSAANTNKDIISSLCAEKSITSPTSPSATSGKQTPNEEELKLRQKERESRIQNFINKRNKLSASPLYIACQNDKPECVKVLLRYGAHLNSASLVDNNDLDIFMSVKFDPDKHLSIIDQLDVKMFKDGGTPLFWLKNPTLIETLLDMKCKIDAKNFKGETALHTFVNKRNLSVVMSLLWHGAEVNAKDTNQQTPLHRAVIADDISIVQALIVFDAEVNIKDSNGCTPRHLCCTLNNSNSDLILYILHVVDAKRCQRNVNTDNLCTDGCALAGTFNGKNKDSPYYRSAPAYNPILFGEIVENALKHKKEQAKGDTLMQVDGNFERKKKRVLCLDGGGIRGLILIQMLSILERRFHLKTYHLFDFISGTSTGGICALAFALERSSKEVRNLYFRLKDKIFTGSRPYDEKVFEQFLKKEFGSETRMSDIKDINLYIPALKADQFPPEIHPFRNYESPESILGEHVDEHDHYIWYVARSSGAAPTYFTSCDKYLDGGLISNNPTLDTLTEITQLNAAYKATGQQSKQLEIEVVVSLGTGEQPIYAQPTPKLHYPTSIFEMTKLYQSVNDLFDLLVEQSTQSNGQVVRRSAAWCSNIKIPYFRLNPPISKNVLLNETDNTILVNLLWETVSYMFSRESEIMKLKNLLM